jgi:hypothetical protein
MDSRRRRHDHPQHRRLHAAHQQRPLPLDHPPRQQAARCLAAPHFARVVSDGGLRLGKETLEVLPCIEQPKYPPVKAIEFHTSITSKFYGDDYAVKG